jgi:hypothetical protein
MNKYKKTFTKKISTNKKIHQFYIHLLFVVFYFDFFFHTTSIYMD